MLDVVVIAHPSARRAPPTRRDRIVDAWRPLGRVHVALTETPGGGTELAAEAVADGAGLVVALGGDGTINAVAAGLVGSDVPLAPLPGGSTNVLARSLGLPRDPVAAAHELRAAFRRRGSTPFPVGMLGERIFLSNAGLGFDALVVAAVENRRRLKRRLGPMLYAATAFGVAARSHPTITVEAGDGVENGADTDPDAAARTAAFVIVLNVSPYTYVGPRPLHLVPDRGVLSGLSIVLVPSTRPGALAALARQGLARTPRGSGSPLEGITVLEHVSHAVIRAEAPIETQVDGEPAGTVEQTVVEYSPKALRLVRLE